MQDIEINGEPRNIAEVAGGAGINALFDSPWVPVFVAVIWLMHPWLGMLAAISAVAASGPR